VISYVLAINWFKPLLFVTYTNHIEYNCNKHNTCVIASLSNIIQTMVASRLHLQYHTGKNSHNWFCIQSYFKSIVGSESGSNGNEGNYAVCASLLHSVWKRLSAVYRLLMHTRVSLPFNCVSWYFVC